MSGKSELIRIGAFDRTDIAMTTHVHMVPVEGGLLSGKSRLQWIYGRAGNCAWKGRPCGSGSMEWSKRSEHCHKRYSDDGPDAGDFPGGRPCAAPQCDPQGRDVLNSVPDEAVVETKVRAASLEMIEKNREKVHRAYDGAAYAFGGKIEREVLQGYMPVIPREADEALIQAARELGLDYRTVQKGDFNNACTDVGDLSHLFPVVNFTYKGFEGKLHGADFRITDPETAYILPAKLQALTAYKLLKNGGEKAREIKDSFQPAFNVGEYIRYVEKLLLGK